MTSQTRYTVATIPAEEHILISYATAADFQDLNRLANCTVGTIVLIPTDENHSMWCDDEAILRGSSFNRRASFLTKSAVFGDAILVASDPDTGKSLNINPRFISRSFSETYSLLPFIHLD